MVKTLSEQQILMHICIITKDPERLYLMEMHLVPLGIADALNDCTDLHGVNGAYDIWGKAVDGATTHNTSGYVTNALPPYKNGVTK